MGEKMTKTTHSKLVEEYNALLIKQEELKLEQVTAREYGDARENAENDAVTSALQKVGADLYRLSELLDDPEIVPPDNSRRINIGSTLEITKVDNETHDPIEETITVVYSSKGNVVTTGQLDADSPLGKLIINGSDGVYTLPIGNGISYRVRKVIG